MRGFELYTLYTYVCIMSIVKFIENTTYIHLISLLVNSLILFTKIVHLLLRETNLGLCSIIHGVQNVSYTTGIYLA